MPQDHFVTFLPAICAGLGLFLAGAANLVLIRKGFALRAVATLASLGLALAAAASIGEFDAVTPTTRLLGLALTPFVLLSSRRLVSGVAGLIAATGRPVIRFGLLTAAGVGIAIGSIVSMERAEEFTSQSALEELELLHGMVPTVLVERSEAVTDKGTKISLKMPTDPRDEQLLSTAEERYLHNSRLNDYVIREGTADEKYNCHGWVFAGGRYLITGSDVDLIVNENGYREQHQPQSGDLVVYRALGAVTHTAVVQYVAEGKPVLVKGKWGNLGIFLHPADKSPYGSDFTFYRSDRVGHTIVGIGGRRAPNDAVSNSPTTN